MITDIEVNNCNMVILEKIFTIDKAKRMVEISITDLLGNINEMFVQLEKDVATLSVSVNNLSMKVFSLISLLTNVIKTAEEDGWGTEDIRKALPDVWRIHRKSSFIRHIQDWPKGYPGDFEIIDILVDRIEQAPLNSLGGVLGRCALSSDIAQQHREKLRLQTDLVVKVCRTFKKPIIVSMACGSSRDLEKCEYEIEASGAKIILIDFNQEALDASLRRLKNIKNQIQTIHTDIRILPKLFSSLTEQNGKFHLIYAGGLTDYLSKKIVQIILKRLSKQFILKEGILMFTNIAKGNPYRPWIETMGNWRLIERTREEMTELLALTNFKKQSLELDSTGLTWIAKATYL